MPTPQIKDEKTCQALRDKGYGEEKAARIANAKANGSQPPGRKGGKTPAYEDWTKEDLEGRARELDIEGRSMMSKDELIEALRGR
jgi:hypothetical protein